MPTFKVNRVIDPVGAGDGFAAGFLSGILNNQPINEAIRTGNAVGAMVVTTEGDIEGLPTYDEIIQFIQTSGDNVIR